METIKGYVDHIIYQNPQNGYTVLVLISDGEEITCTGTLKGIDEGENIEAEGSYIEHPVYGSQLKISTYRTIIPDDAYGMERYLGSGAIKGVGEALARRIVKKFGSDTFRIIEEEPERLIEIKGISERIAREIADQMQDKKEMREAFVFLQRYGISNTLAVKIYNTYGPRLYGIMNENPYRLAEDINGVGFRTADEIARAVGIHTDSDYRICSGILYTLLQASLDGHIYLPADLLAAKAEEILSVDKSRITPQLTNMAMDKKLVIKRHANEQRIYSYPYYYAELKCAKLLCDLNFTDENNPGEEANIRESIEKLSESLKMEPDDLQIKAIYESTKRGVVIISGGPGTGKTTIINSIIQLFAEQSRDILLAAPTGRAAKRMTEATGYEAKTIHRLLEVNGSVSEENGSARFERNEENPLEADVIIIDEMSMVDIHLFLALLQAVSIGTRLILVGDMDQLPSVGPGQVLKDIISSACFSTVILKKIFRQAAESDIIVNAHRINAGETIRLDNKSRDFFFLERNDPNVIYKHMIQLIKEKLPAYVDASPYDIQVLTPMRKGHLGVETLNHILQQYLNPPDEKKKEYQAGEQLYRVGDKVMQIKNNYSMEWEVLSKYGIPIDKGLGIFNGDSGIIREINENAGSMTVEYDEKRQVTYSFGQLDEIELAYAITIHKSQGSEYPAVLLPLLSGPRMLFNRNLLYTSVTRARKCVTILGSRAIISEMINNISQNSRCTSLHERIKEVNGSDMPELIWKEKE